MPDSKILVVEDDAVQMRQMVRMLEDEGYRLSRASCGTEAIRILEERSIDLVLTDRRMPNLNGDSLVDYIRRNHSTIPVAVITAYPEGVEELNPDGVLEKPFKGGQLLELVQGLLGGRAN